MALSNDEIIQQCIALLKKNGLSSQRMDFVANKTASHRELLVLLLALKRLDKRQMLTPDNFDAIKNHPHFQKVTFALDHLDGKNMLDQKNFDVIINHAHPIELSNTLYNLKQADRLNQENFDAIINHAHFDNIGFIFFALNRQHILTSDNFDTLKNHDNIPQIAEALNELFLGDILDQDNFDAIKNHVAPVMLATEIRQLNGEYMLTQENRAYIAKVLEYLHEAGILIQDNVDTIKNHENHPGMLAALERLQKNNLLTQDNFDLIKYRQQPLGCARKLVSLSKTNSLTQQNRNHLKNEYQPNPQWVNKALVYLKHADINTPQNIHIIQNHDNISGLTAALKHLQTEHILTQDTFNIIKTRAQPDGIAWSLVCLSKEDNLTLENRRLIVSHGKHRELAQALNQLKAAKIQTPKYYDMVIEHQDPLSCAKALEILHYNANTLPRECWKSSLKSSNPFAVAQIFYHLSKAQIMNSENYAVATDPYRHADLSDRIRPLPIAQLSDAVAILGTTGILTQANFDCLSCEEYFNDNPHRHITTALTLLHEANLLTQRNFDAITTSLFREELRDILALLHKAHSLTQSNFDVIKDHHNLPALNEALRQLNPPPLAPARVRETFAALVAPQHAALLTPEARQAFWNRIPERLLYVNWERILEIARGDDPVGQLQRFGDQLLATPQTPQWPLPGVANLIHAPTAVPNINSGQSTHTASVHQSTSASATRLRTRYPLDRHAQETILNEIAEWLENLPTHSDTQKAARRCFLRIRDLLFIDPTSRVTVPQLLALAWAAIHDDAQRAGTVEDAEQQFVQGLYEIQREYNLDEKGNDIGGPDDNTCYAGTFNKIIEKLVGIHPLAELIMVTKGQAASKLPSVVREEVRRFLQDHPEACEPVAEEGLDASWEKGSVWNHIRPTVFARLWDEFGTLYQGQHDPGFIAFLDTGQYTDIQKIVKIEQNRLSATSTSSQTSGIQRFGIFTPGNNPAEEKEKENVHQSKKSKSS